MAGISISIKAGATVDSSAVQASGNVIHIITPTERDTFKIQDAALKAAVAAYFGQAPDDAFLSEPTPWGGLYNTYHWHEVKTSLMVQKAEILGITSEPAIIATKDFANNSRHKATFNCAITDDVTNTTETTWSESHSIDVNQSVHYEIGFLGTGGGGSTSFNYNYAWGKGGSESKSVTVGSTEGVSVDLEPGQKVQAKLTASRGVMKVRITYLASIAGTVAINYGDTYKGHHFFGLDLHRVMGAAKLPFTHTVTEDIEIGYYSNATIELVDPSGMLKSVMADGRPATAGVRLDGLVDAALQAKRKTVDELKAFEANKGQASTALAAKLSDFRASLDASERDELGSLLELGGAPADAGMIGAESAFLKPMQRDGGTGIEQDVFLKPMQRDGGTGIEQDVFLKPMQRAD